MNVSKFFELAKSKGITQSQLAISKYSSTKITLFHHEIDNYKISENVSITAIGIYDGKLGSASTEKTGVDAFEYLVDQIILTATYSEKPRKIGLFEGVSKYKSAKTFDKTLYETPIEKKIEDLRELENAIYAQDERITDVDSITYAESDSYSEIHNSFGAKARQRNNYYYFLAGAVARQGEETKTYYKIHFDHDYKTFNKDAFAKEVAEKTLSKFGGVPCASSVYPTVLHREVIGSLISYFLSNVIAEKVQKGSSALAGKVGKKIASSKLTIEEKPLAKTMFFSAFDDELVPTQNKFIIKNGVLQTFIYNRETAEKDGVESTGNGAWSGSKFGTSIGSVYVKGGKKSLDKLVANIDKGVYVTEVAGLGTGMNTTSGNFSCQAEGYLIENGKISKPLNLITLSGNLFKMLNDIVEFANNNELDESGMAIADVLIRKMNIAGE